MRETNSVAGSELERRGLPLLWLDIQATTL